MTKTITFGADKLKVNGPKADGGLTVSFDTGEYMQQEVAKLLMIPQNTVVTVTVEYDDLPGDYQMKYLAPMDGIDPFTGEQPYGEPEPTN